MSKLKVNAFRSFCAESLNKSSCLLYHFIIINLVACELTVVFKVHIVITRVRVERHQYYSGIPFYDSAVLCVAKMFK